jgi:hypothetical protein
MATKSQVTIQCMKGKPAKVDAFGCNGKDPQTAVTAPANATDLATCQTLTNAIKAALIANGIMV